MTTPYENWLRASRTEFFYRFAFSYPFSVLVISPACETYGFSLHCLSFLFSDFFPASGDAWFRISFPPSGDVWFSDFLFFLYIFFTQHLATQGLNTFIFIFYFYFIFFSFISIQLYDAHFFDFFRFSILRYHEDFYAREKILKIGEAVWRDTFLVDVYPHHFFPLHALPR